MQSEHNRSRVPFEFVGRARVFRDRVLATNEPTLEAIKRIYQTLAVRARRSPLPRKELLRAATAAWKRDIPDFGRLDRQIDEKRNTSKLVEIRLGGGYVHYPGWLEAEKGIGIVVINLQCEPGRCELKSQIICLIGLHALGRWMQRTHDQNEINLLRDLAALAHESDQLLKCGDRLDDQSFVCQVLRGAWVGQVVRLRSERTGAESRVLSVRSFLNMARASERDGVLL